MRVHSVATSIQTDGNRRLEIFASGELFRYAIDAWTSWPADHPITESTTGYWSEQYVSGFFESADAAMSDAHASHFMPEVQE